MAAFVRNTRRYNQQAYGKPANTLEYTIDRDSDGALGNQIYLLGHFDLEYEEALVVDVRLGGARYFVAPITNHWGTTNGIVDRTGSLNLAQSLRNDDGTLTLVVSKHDPGVPNWLDPSGMREGILTLRWAEFEGGAPGADLGRRVGWSHCRTCEPICGRRRRSWTRQRARPSRRNAPRLSPAAPESLTA